MNVYSFLENSSLNYPNNTAIVYWGERINYKTLAKLTGRMGCVLKEYGVKKGDRITLLLDNSINYVISYFAVLKIGGVVVALNPDTTYMELEKILNSCKPKGIITSMACYKYIPELPCIEFKVVEGYVANTLNFNNIILDNKERDCDIVDVDEKNDLAQIIYTSGTTGKPKGVMLTHLNLISNTESIIRYLKLTAEDKVMVILPFFYSYGNSLLLTHIKVGGTLVISHQFVFLNKVLEMMIQEKVTGFAGVPSSYVLLLRKSNIRKLKFPHLKYLTCAGGALSPANIVELKSILPNVDYYAMYGQTEATARLSYLEPHLWKEKLGSAGKAIPGVELKVKNKKGQEVGVGEVGEIVVAKGLNIMKGYWEQPEETKKVLKKDGLHTGDMARIDEEGYIYIIGRKSDMIKTGAYRVSPQEIEEVLSKHKDILECAVVGLPDPILGEVIKAFVVLTDNVHLDEKELLRFCKKNLPYYKIPTYIEFVTSLPKTKSGKIKRYELKKIN